MKTFGAEDLSKRCIATRPLRAALERGHLMKKICLALAACGVLVPAPAVAGPIIGGPFKNHGDCVSQIALFTRDIRNDNLDPWVIMRKYADDELECVKKNDRWYIAIVG
jgi:hypothetical protein